MTAHTSFDRITKTQGLDRRCVIGHVLRMFEVNQHDIRDGETGHDYVGRLPWWRKIVLFLIMVGGFVGVIFLAALLFVTFSQLLKELPLWLNFYILISFFLICLLTAAVLELRDRRRFRP